MFVGFVELGGVEFDQVDSFIELPCAEMRWERPTALVTMGSRTADVKKGLSWKTERLS